MPPMVTVLRQQALAFRNLAETAADMTVRWELMQLAERYERCAAHKARRHAWTGTDPATNSADPAI